MAKVGKNLTPTILVADDDQEVIESVKIALEGEEYEVISAGNGSEALSKFKENDVDIVVSDIKMPEMDGLELLKNVKELSPSTKVIMMTAYASVDTAVEAMKEGANDYIRKPMDAEDIKTTIMGSIENLEIEKFGEETSEIRRGRGEDKPYRTFERLVEKGKRGLFITKDDLDEVKDTHDFGDNVKVVDLSSEEEGINLEDLEDTIDSEMSEYGNLVILIDVLNYILNYNSIEDFKKFINKIEDDIIDKSSTLIISGDSKDIDQLEQDELEYMASDMPARAISDSLANHIRRKVITRLSNKEEGITFTTLSNETGINDSPKLSFHLKKLEEKGLIEKDDERRYHLTSAGEDAFETLEKLRDIRGDGFGQITWIPR